MHPELFTIPGLGITVHTYGFFLMIGFLTAVWLCMRRASRVKASPDRILDMAFFALLFGVGGARAFYVVHYWQPDFANADNLLWKIIDIRQGGLEFLGGLLGALAALVGFMLWNRLSIRMYLDIMAPSAMWGLALGRIGCFFNGCCFGGLCVVPGTTEANHPWALEFPYGSPAHYRQWEERQVTVPAELITSLGLLSPKVLAMSVEEREKPAMLVAKLRRQLTELQSEDGSSKDIEKLTAQLKSARGQLESFRRAERIDELEIAQRYPSREHPERNMSVSELQDLAAASHSLPIHPVQLYASIHALLLSGFLSAVVYRRKRHGLVVGLLFLLYPIGRVTLEIIRADNPHDTFGLTVSTFVSGTMMFIGVACIIIIYRYLPERSPSAVAEAAG